MGDPSLAERIVVGEEQRMQLVEELMNASAEFIQKSELAERSEFIVARYRDRDHYEPWFEICLPTGLHLRVNVELRAI